MVSLLDLPIDLLDLIVQQTMSWPAHVGDYLASSDRTRELLSSPTFGTCQLLRERSFAALGTACVWVKVVGLTEAAIESLRYLAHDLPVPGHLWLALLDRHVIPHILIKISDVPTPQDDKDDDNTNNRPKYDAVGVVNESYCLQEAASEDSAQNRACQRTNQENGERNGLEQTVQTWSIMFPYEYESFLRFCVATLAVESSIRYFTGLSRSTSTFFQSILDTEAAPIILRTSDLYPLKLLTERQNNETDQSSLDIHQRRLFLHTAGAIIEQALDIKEARGSSSKSDLFLLYFGIPLRRIGASYLTSMQHWISDIVDSQHGSPNAHERVAVRNDSLTLLHYLECETCDIFVKLSKSRGRAWCLGNYSFLSDDGERWLKEPPWQWFGLLNMEMATLHLARAALLWHMGCTAPPLQWRFRNFTLRTTDDLIEAMQNMYVAQRLHSSVCASASDLLEQASHFIGEYLPWISPDITVATFMDTVGNWHHWTGTNTMFRGWGSFASLRWLPLAQWSRQNVRTIS